MKMHYNNYLKIARCTVVNCFCQITFIKALTIRQFEKQSRCRTLRQQFSTHNLYLKFSPTYIGVYSEMMTEYC